MWEKGSREHRTYLKMIILLHYQHEILIFVRDLIILSFDGHFWGRGQCVLKLNYGSAASREHMYMQYKYVWMSKNDHARLHISRPNHIIIHSCLATIIPWFPHNSHNKIWFLANNIYTYIIIYVCVCSSSSGLTNIILLWCREGILENVYERRREGEKNNNNSDIYVDIWPLNRSQT